MRSNGEMTLHVSDAILYQYRAGRVNVRLIKDRHGFVCTDCLYAGLSRRMDPLL